jgi:hypothetical protein
MAPGGRKDLSDDSHISYNVPIQRPTTYSSHSNPEEIHRNIHRNVGVNLQT